jgi:hypothetical protein
MRHRAGIWVGWFVIAPAGSGSGPIKDGDAAVPVIDGPNSLQGARREGDTGTAHGKHHREEFLGKRQHVRFGAVMRHQQPTREPFLEAVVRIAGCRMRNLDVQHLRKPQNLLEDWGCVRSLEAKINAVKADTAALRQPA